MDLSDRRRSKLVPTGGLDSVATELAQGVHEVPSLRSHQVLARALTRELRSELGWDH